MRAESSATNHYRFLLPHEARYHIDETDALAAPSSAEWLKARPDDGSTNFVQFGNRIVVQLKSANALQHITSGHALKLSETVVSNVFILQCPDALTAVREAHRLAQLPEVLASYPVMKKAVGVTGTYAPQPNDTYYRVEQWYLEHRGANGVSTGVDLNVRAAWPFTRGEGITLATVDYGVELSHPELTNRVAGAPHFNFATQTTNGAPILRNSTFAHGTECSGLMVAEANNGVGMAGVAPKAQLASWIIFDTNTATVSDDRLMTMYQYQSNVVSVQNHSWAHVGFGQNSPTLLEQIGLSNAFTFGRSGKGVVMIRSAGNTRVTQGNADDDGYPNDPRVIGVGAVRIDGRVTTYSSPGACLLVGAPSGDTAFNSSYYGLFTTDLIGTDGANQFNFFPPDLNNYVFDSFFGFSGTSASAPLVAGVAGLILSANTNLTYRDVQQIMLLSSRHFDFADPDLVTNGAGFLVSHNLGFGIPDAGAAVNLARRWTNRPPQVQLTFALTNQAPIPDDGLRLLITGSNIPPSLASIETAPSTGPHADAPTLNIPLADVGQATNTITNNLAGHAALIQRSDANFSDTITRAAQAGAVFAIVYNNAVGSSGCGGGDNVCPMGATDFVPIPAVFIGQTAGESLRSLIVTNNTVLAQIHLNSTNYIFNVTNTLSCEQVGVRVKTDHPVRGNVRITMISPQGTRSVLQRLNLDGSPGPVDWTYYSTHHFFESSAGTWTVSVSDEAPGNTGNVNGVSLILNGVPITDTDHDGLDDNWELAHFGTLAYGPKDDPDKDGYNNAFEQVLGSNPLAADVPFNVNVSFWNTSLARVSWPSSTNYNYQVLGGTNILSLSVMTNVPGQFPETAAYFPYAGISRQFFRVQAVPNP